MKRFFIVLLILGVIALSGYFYFTGVITFQTNTCKGVKIEYEKAILSKYYDKQISNEYCEETLVEEWYILYFKYTSPENNGRITINLKIIDEADNEYRNTCTISLDKGTDIQGRSQKIHFHKSHRERVYGTTTAGNVTYIDKEIIGEVTEKPKIKNVFIESIYCDFYQTKIE